MFKKAIITKYLGPTDFKGSRIKASCFGGNVTVGYSSELSTEQNHALAAEMLLKKMGWAYETVAGVLPSGEYCFVLTEKRSES